MRCRRSTVRRRTRTGTRARASFTCTASDTGSGLAAQTGDVLNQAGTQGTVTLHGLHAAGTTNPDAFDENRCRCVTTWAPAPPRARSRTSRSTTRRRPSRAPSVRHIPATGGRAEAPRLASAARLRRGIRCGLAHLPDRCRGCDSGDRADHAAVGHHHVHAHCHRRRRQHQHGHGDEQGRLTCRPSRVPSAHHIRATNGPAGAPS